MSTLLGRLKSTGTFAPLVLVLIASLPFWFIQTQYILSVCTLTLIFMTATIGWNLISGYGGQVSFGQSIFFGVGAYATTILQTRYSGNAWVGLLLGIVVAVVVALLLGWLTLRLRGFYFGLATFTLSLVFEILAVHFRGFTGGVGGLTLSLHGNSPAQFSFDNKLWYYYVALAFAVIAFAVSYFVVNSRLGLQLRSIQADHDAAQASGVMAFRVKMTAFAISAALAALAGAAYVQYVGFLDPESVFGAAIATQIAVMGFVGGARKLWGPVVGAALLIPLQNVLNSELASFPAGFNLVVYGVVILIVLWVEPRGLLWMRLPSRLRGSGKGNAGDAAQSNISGSDRIDPFQPSLAEVDGDAR